ncbi:MAG: outer membrane protein assembly factor BamE [Rickettsiales bacterium]|nr:outer membrane protein assembly factor BamE [Rickettsiales bacterium]
MMRQEHHGKELTNEVLVKLRTKKSTKEDVLEILGTPSSISAFNDDIWYYISLKKKGVSVLKPKITEQIVIELKFKNNLLMQVKKYNADQVPSFKFNKQKTKVEGSDPSALKDFVRNLGRYNKDPKRNN